MPTVQSCTLSRFQLQTTFDEKNFGHYSLKYIVVTDGALGHLDVANGATASAPHPLPTWGATYNYLSGTDLDNTSFAQNFAIESDPENQKYYYITVNYKPLDENRGDDDQFETNPLLRAPIVWADRETFTRIMEKCEVAPSGRTDKAIVNACGRQYDVPYEEEDSHGVLIVEFNVATLSQVLAYQRFLRRAVNRDVWTFLGVQFPERTVAARDVAAGPPITEGSTTYFHMIFRFAIADGDTSQLTVSGGLNWDVPILERGYQYFLKTGGQFEQLNGQKLYFPRPSAPPPHNEDLPEPVNLAADGTRLPDGQLGVFTNWRMKREVPFQLLGFPTTP